MRTIIIIFILTCQFSFSQTVIDMATSHTVDWNRKNGQNYLKDVNGYFNDFIGTWKYEYEGYKEFRIIITKVEMYHLNETWGSNTFNYYTDGVYTRYEKYENGVLTYASPVETAFPSGISKAQGELAITFFDYERLAAGFNADLTLTQEIQQGGSDGEIKLHFLLDKFEALNPYHDEHPNEPFFSVPNDIEMTKVE